MSQVEFEERFGEVWEEVTIIFKALFFKKKWANPGLFLLFSLFSHYNFNNTN